jgi:hypothetical protein
MSQNIESGEQLKALIFNKLICVVPLFLVFNEDRSAERLQRSFSYPPAIIIPFPRNFEQISKTTMRPRKPTKGRVTGAKFEVTGNQEENDLKKAKAKILKELQEQEKNKKDWFDKELDKNLKK